MVHIIYECIGCYTMYVCVMLVCVCMIMVLLIFECIGCYTMYVCVMLVCVYDNGAHYI